MKLWQATALYTGYVAALHVVPGPWRKWSKGAVWDNWTYTHIASGIVAALLKLPRKEYIALATANEAVEWYIRKTRPDLLWGEPESNMNVLMDLVTGIAGYEATRALQSK